MSPETSAEEQTREERLDIARRYRERRGATLRALAAPHVEGEVEAAGEFSTVATEALAAIPGLGMLLLPLARRRARRQGLAPKVLIALTADRVHALPVRPADMRRDHTEAEPGPSWPRGEVSAERAGRAFMRDRVDLHVPGSEEPLRLFAPPLIRNPWTAEVVRLLGGEAPEPLDLSLPPRQPPA